MRLEVTHRTVYTFDQPMRWITQSHRMTPAANGSQRPVSWSITVEGGESGARFTDGAGDVVTTMTVRGPLERLEVLVEGVIETTDTAGVLRDQREIISPRVYLTPTAAVKPGVGLVELKERALSGVADETVLARAHLLSAAVSDAIEYLPGQTDSATTAAEALERGSGVCQDHAHALIALAHATGLPARYVTGYLLASDGLAAEEATHAWAELWIDGLGWVGFDAANRWCPDERYVRLGSGRDARDAAPIRGVSRGGGVEAMDVSVVVSQTQGQSQSQTQQ